MSVQDDLNPQSEDSIQNIKKLSQVRELRAREVLMAGKPRIISEEIKQKLNNEVQEILQECLKEVEDLLRKESGLLDRFAQELLTKDELNYDEIEAIFNEFGKSRPPLI